MFEQLYRRLICAMLAASLLTLAALPAAAWGSVSFVNPTEIFIPGTYIGPATPYPSSVTVAGQDGTVAKATVLLIDMDSGGLTDEVDLALVGPSGQRVMLMSDACGVGAFSDREFTFTDAAAAPMPDSGPCPSGTYTPSNYVGGAPEPDDLSAGGGPPPPFATQLSVFNGKSPNGNWNLFVYSDTSGDFMRIGAWALTLDIQPPAAAPTPPRNDFSIGRVTRRPNGTATLLVTVPGPGTLTLGGNGVVPQRGARSIRAPARSVAAAGTVSLTVKAADGAKRKLNRKGKARVAPTITFTPTGGTAASQRLVVTLKKKPRG